MQLVSALVPHAGRAARALRSPRARRSPGPATRYTKTAHGHFPYLNQRKHAVVCDHNMLQRMYYNTGFAWFGLRTCPYEQPSLRGWKLKCFLSLLTAIFF